MPSPEGKEWLFEQLSGSKKKMLLSGWAAPHGRARQGPVVSDGIRVRAERVYYPGNDDGPTRHIFGHEYTDWELKGRFRDRAGGSNFAKVKTEAVKAFVADKQPVRISWGDVLSIKGFLDEFVPGRESEGEVEWTLKISVDTDENIKPPKRKVKSRTASDFSRIVADELRSALNALQSSDIPLKGSILDAIDNVVSAVTNAAGQLRSAADGIASFEKATFGELSRLQSAVATVKEAGLTLRETAMSVRSDAALARETADHNTKYWDAQTTVDEAMREVLAELADMDRAAAEAKAGRTKTIYQAREGDTWESISTQFYGAPDRAGDIRDANDVPPGQAPVVGREYMIPE